MQTYDIAVIGGGAAGLVVASVAAQLSAFGGPIARSDMAYMAGDPALSYSILETHLAVDSTDYEALWRAARAAVVIGIEQEDERAQNDWLDPAIRLSEQAVIARPDGIDGIYWRGVAAGRRAMSAERAPSPPGCTPRAARGPPAPRPAGHPAARRPARSVPRPRSGRPAPPTGPGR